MSWLGVALAAWLVMGHGSQEFIDHSWEGASPEQVLASSVWNLQRDTLVEQAVKMRGLQRQVPCCPPLTACAHSPTSPARGGGQRFSESQGAVLLFQTFPLSIPGT